MYNYDLMIMVLKQLRSNRQIRKTTYIRDEKYIVLKDSEEAKCSYEELFQKELAKERENFACPIAIVSGYFPPRCEVKNLDDYYYFDIGTWESNVIDCESCIQAWLNKESEG